MRGTDMVVLTKDESASAGVAWDVGDYWSTDFVTPTLDDKQARARGSPVQSGWWGSKKWH